MPLKKSINRPLISLERGTEVRGEEEKRRKKLLLDHRQNFAGTSQDHHRSLTGPPQESRRTTAGASPDHRRSFAAPPPQGLTFRPNVLLKARHSAEDLTFCSRPNIMLKSRRSAEGPTFCSRPDVLLKV
ncbi:hypothetical protein MA16_Dca020281 [Dendrobium catenatum]|uniref:Uncharacterized protein n=1 Tax=Dendrobium catenatum TaxID=906689 RepID=A0A2I0X468_9ASPA|nr:hypothetical protein MA16_Dca020281 [Dendrobium catenatum]